MTTAAPPPRVVPTPETVVVDGFVIETYPTIAQVPFASISDQRGKALKTSEHERFDELYGRCRICMGHKAGDQLILCDICDRGYHLTCLIPALRDVPKGEWHCPNCTREQKHNFHTRATAIATIGRILSDIEARPTLPPKLKLKMLNLPSPTVQFTRVPATLQSRKEKHQAPSYQNRPHRTLPLKFRMKNERFSEQELEKSSIDVDKTILYKTVNGESLQRRRDHVSRLAKDLVPVAERFNDGEVISSLGNMQNALLWADNNHPEGDFIETRTSDNSPTKTKKRTRTNSDGNDKSSRKRANKGESSTRPQQIPAQAKTTRQGMSNHSESRAEGPKKFAKIKPKATRQ